MTLKNSENSRMILLELLIVLTIVIFLIAAVVFAMWISHSAERQVQDDTPEYRYSDFWFNCLTASEQLLYDTIRDAAAEYRESTDVLGCCYTEEEFTRVVDAVLADLPEMFWLERDRITLEVSDQRSLVTISYRHSEDSLLTMEARLEEAVETILEELETNSDAESLLLQVHDHIARSVTFCETENGSYASTAYGALVVGKAVSKGYAAACKLLLQRLGQYCVTVSGASYNSDHSWNIVYFNDFYAHIDIAWDDPDLPYLPQLVSHAYFGLSDEEIGHDHAVYNAALLPQCAVGYDYYRSNGLLTETGGEAELLSTLTEQAVDAGSYLYEFRTPDETDAGSIEEILNTITEADLRLSGSRVYPLDSSGSIFAVQLYPAMEN